MKDPGDEAIIRSIEEELSKRDEWKFSVDDALELLPSAMVPDRVRDVAGTSEAPWRMRMFLDHWVGHEFSTNRFPREHFVLEASWFPGDYWLREVNAG